MLTVGLDTGVKKNEFPIQLTVQNSCRLLTPF